MYRRVKLNNLNDFFLKLSSRKEKGVYFYRLNNYNPQIEEFLVKYLQQAKRTGVVIIGKIQNPDENQLSYYEEMMGKGFAMNQDFFISSLKKWMPGLDERQRQNIAISIFNTLSNMAKMGKNENILKNAYIKFMCWLYYKFARIIRQLGMEDLPKIIYDNQITNYELKMLGIIADAGCDVLIIQKAGDAGYHNLDPQSKESCLYETSAQQPFPKDFSLLELEKGMKEKQQMSRIYDEGKTKICSTNTWLTGDVLRDTLKLPKERGNDPSLIYNAFVKLSGVEDKAAYSGQLFRWKAELSDMGRKVYVIESLPVPTPGEIASVNKNNYKDMQQLLIDITSHIKSKNPLVENQAKKALIELLEEENKNSGGNLNRVKNKAIYGVCWLNRYINDIFGGFSEGNIPIFVYFGVCRNGMESFFMRFLSKLPLDVVIINPNLSLTCALEDRTLFEQKNDISMQLDTFPINANDISYGTAAFHAEQDLTEIMYQDSGLYRNMQYQKAVAITLQTMYEEIYILWDQESKYRPNFETVENQVVVPVIAAKVSGVKDGNQTLYLQDIRKLMVEDTIVIKDVPHISAGSVSGAQFASQFLKNRKLMRDKIKNHQSYKYGIFREETQQYIFDKIEELINSGIIKGTFSNGMEFKIIAVALNMEKEVTRFIQKMDFTKKIPKLIYIATAENQCSMEDAIMIALLHFLGFDIVMFVPTGYQIIEQHYEKPLLVEHQIGEYIYDMQIPVLNLDSNTPHSEGFMNKLFRRR